MSTKIPDDCKVAQHGCGLCGKPAPSRCSRCKRVYYCCADHSAKDWKTHKAQCKSNPTPPYIKTYDAILFAHDDIHPRMVKVPIKTTTTGLEVTDPPAPWKSSTSPFWVSPQVPGRPMLVALHNDNFSNDGSPRNRCIQSVTGGEAKHPWADNVLVLRKRSVYDEMFQSAVWDEDLPVMVERWRTYT